MTPSIIESVLTQLIREINNSANMLAGNGLPVISTQLINISNSIQQAGNTLLFNYQVELAYRIYRSYGLLFPKVPDVEQTLTAEEWAIVNNRRVNLKKFYRLFKTEGTAERVKGHAVTLHTNCPYGKVDRKPRMDIRYDIESDNFIITAEDPLDFNIVTLTSFDINKSTLPIVNALLDHAYTTVGYFEIDVITIENKLSELIDSLYNMVVVNSSGNLYDHYETYSIERMLIKLINQEKSIDISVGRLDPINSLCEVKFVSFNRTDVTELDSGRAKLMETATFRFSDNLSNSIFSTELVFIYSSVTNHWYPLFDRVPMIEYLFDRLVSVLESAELSVADNDEDRNTVKVKGVI